ncbi:hypothetical protein CGUA_09360 [Corynebacterium guangdongense]|nr:hypothetical protein CGUA_09360 [Corynebacterium guangdongense]
MPCSRSWPGTTVGLRGSITPAFRREPVGASPPARASWLEDGAEANQGSESRLGEVMGRAGLPRSISVLRAMEVIVWMEYRKG